jgi:hypothetical protein
VYNVLKAIAFKDVSFTQSEYALFESYCSSSPWCAPWKRA